MFTLKKEKNISFFFLLGHLSCGQSFIFLRSWAEGNGGDQKCTPQQSASSQTVRLLLGLFCLQT